VNVGDNYNRPKVLHETLSCAERIGTIIGDRKQFGDDYVINSYLFRSKGLLNPRLIREAIRRASLFQASGLRRTRKKKWSYVKGIVERNSLSGKFRRARMA
jgi:hypothetical protein